MKRIIGILVFSFIIINLVGLVVFLEGNNSQPKTNIQETQSNTQTDVSNNANQDIPSSEGKISSSELSKHKTLNDCWIGFEGKAYDISDFLPKHPGSAGAIVPYCGTSGAFEEAFSDQHGTSQVSRLIREGTYKGDLA